MRLPRPRRARPDGGAVGDDPEGEVDGDAAAAEVPRALLPRVGLQEVPEAAPHAHPSISLSLPPASGSAVAEVEFPGCGGVAPGRRRSCGTRRAAATGPPRAVGVGFSVSLPLTSGPVLPMQVGLWPFSSLLPPFLFLFCLFFLESVYGAFLCSDDACRR